MAGARCRNRRPPCLPEAPGCKSSPRIMIYPVGASRIALLLTSGLAHAYEFDFISVGKTRLREDLV